MMEGGRRKRKRVRRVGHEGNSRGIKDTKKNEMSFNLFGTTNRLGSSFLIRFLFPSWQFSSSSETEMAAWVAGSRKE